MVTDLIKEAKEARLKYTSDDIDGIKRFKKDNKFFFLGPKAEKITDKNTLDRIVGLSIPPAWKNVWISPFGNSHLQATGFDEKGRKQYLYHQKWLELCQQNKFDKMIFFGKTLPSVRRKVRKDMNQVGMEQSRILATVVWLLEHTFIRVGNVEYVKENQSFGLTTLRNKHVNVKGSTIKFKFKGKSGIEHFVEVEDPKIAKVVKRCIELPGFELFQYIDDDGKIKVIDSADVNDYLQQVTGEEISAKEFRTWGGTVLGAITLHKLGDFTNEESGAKNIREAVKVVSDHLRNTVSVCQKYYIHPTIISTYQNKNLVPFFNNFKGKKIQDLNLPEIKVINLLQKY